MKRKFADDLGADVFSINFSEEHPTVCRPTVWNTNVWLLALQEVISTFILESEGHKLLCLGISAILREIVVYFSFPTHRPGF